MRGTAVEARTRTAERPIGADLGGKAPADGPPPATSPESARWRPRKRPLGARTCTGTPKRLPKPLDRVACKSGKPTRYPLTCRSCLWPSCCWRPARAARPTAAPSGLWSWARWRSKQHRDFKPDNPRPAVLPVERWRCGPDKSPQRLQVGLVGPIASYPQLLAQGGAGSAAPPLAELVNPPTSSHLHPYPTPRPTGFVRAGPADRPWRQRTTSDPQQSPTRPRRPPCGTLRRGPGPAARPA